MKLFAIAATTATGFLVAEPGSIDGGRQRRAQVSDQVPQVSNQVPQVSNQVAQVSNQVAQVSNQVAQVSNQVPQESNQVRQESNQVPQESNQVPQVSNQKPQISNQKPQQEEGCCSRFIFGDWQTYFTQDGEHKGKPIYRTLVPHNQANKTLFWRFDNVPDSRPRAAVPGTWCFGDDVNDTGASVSSKSLGDESTCPSDQMNEWTFPIDLKCSGAQDVTTCDEAIVQNRNIFLPEPAGASGPVYSCKVQDVMWQMAGTQADQVAELTKNYELRSAFNQAVNAWTSMVNNKACGFVGTDNYAPSCSSLCKNVKNLGNVQDFAPVLNQFVDYAQIYFENGSTTCSKYQQEIYTQLSKYQKYIGVLTNLPESFQENLKNEINFKNE